MARAGRCDGCGTELSPDSRYCVKCGHARATPILDLERVDVEPAGDRAVEHAVAEQRGPRPPRRRSLVALVALLVVIAGAVVLLSGGDGGDEDDALGPSTTEPGPTTTRPRRTTTSRQSTVITGQVGAPGPVLGVPTGGLSLYAVSRDDMVRVELDTGAVTVRRDAFEFNSPAFGSSVLVAGDRLVVNRGGSVFVAPTDLSADPEWLRGLSVDGFDLRADRLLAISNPEPLKPVEVREFDATGNVVTTWKLPAQSWPRGFLGDRLVTQIAGRIYFVGADGHVEAYAVGEPIYAVNSMLLWRHCDDELECSLSLDDVELRTSLPVAGLDGSEFYYFGRALAPDGRSALVMFGTEARLVDLATGAQLAEPDDVTQAAWSPDGAWLFTRADNSSLVALSTRGAAPIEIPMPAGFTLRAADLVLAVG